MCIKVHAWLSIGLTGLQERKNVVVVSVICLDKVMVVVFFVQSSSALLKYTQSRDCMCGMQIQSRAAETVCVAYRRSLVLRDCMCGVQMQSSASETVCAAYRCSPVLQRLCCIRTQSNA